MSILTDYYGCNDQYLFNFKDTFELSLKYTLGGHTKGVAYFAWSPDDNYLLALGPEESSDFWLWDTQVRGSNVNYFDDDDDPWLYHFSIIRPAHLRPGATIRTRTV